MSDQVCYPSESLVKFLFKFLPINHEKEHASYINDNNHKGNSAFHSFAERRNTAGGDKIINSFNNTSSYIDKTKMEVANSIDRGSNAMIERLESLSIPSDFNNTINTENYGVQKNIMSENEDSDSFIPSKPFVTLTYAQSLDAKIAAEPGIKTSISSKETKSMTHFLRSCHDAILIGAGTAISDDPVLNCRLPCNLNDVYIDPITNNITLNSDIYEYYSDDDDSEIVNDVISNVLDEKEELVDDATNDASSVKEKFIDDFINNNDINTNHEKSKNNSNNFKNNSNDNSKKNRKNNLKSKNNKNAGNTMSLTLDQMIPKDLLKHSYINQKKLLRPIIVDPDFKWNISKNSRVIKAAIEGKGLAPWIISIADQNVVKTFRKKIELVESVGGEVIFISPNEKTKKRKEVKRENKNEDKDDSFSLPKQHDINIPWNKILETIADLGITSVMVEGGGSVIKDFLGHPELINSLIVTVAPFYLGADGLSVVSEHGNRFSNTSWWKGETDVVLCSDLSRPT